MVGIISLDITIYPGAAEEERGHGRPAAQLEIKYVRGFSLPFAEKRP